MWASEDERQAELGFYFVTNLGPAGEYLDYGDDWPSDDEYIDHLVAELGAENVTVTEPAYDISGRSFNGRAVYVRRES